MGRIRTIKPEFFLDEDLFDLEKQSRLPVRLAYAGLWTQADREGRFEWRPRTLKAAILPHDGANFEKILEALERSGRLHRYGFDGREYGWIRSWKRHQVINNKERESNFPPPHGEVTGGHALSTREERDSDASITRDERVTQGKERNTRAERDGNGNGTGKEQGTEENEEWKGSRGTGTAPLTGTETTPPSPPQGGNLASSKNTKRIALLLMEKLQITNDPSLDETFIEVASGAVDFYPGKSEEDICDVLLQKLREYEKKANNEGKQAITPDKFFSWGLWKEASYWNSFLMPLDSKPKQSERTKPRVVVKQPAVDAGGRF
jgi:hypothetical protein